MMKELDELSIENRYKMGCVLHLYKCLKFDTCQYTLSLLDQRARVYQTRNQFLYLTWVPKTNAGICSLINAAIDTWNKVEINKLKFANLEELKHQLKGTIWDLFGNFNPS